MTRTQFFAMSALIGSALATPAAAELKYENQSGGYVKLYGQFSPTFQSVDDGVDTYDNVLDNSHSNTRVGMTVVQPMEGGTFEFNLETGLGWTNTAGVSQESQSTGLDWERTSIRKVDATFEGDSWGKIYIGQGSMATDGVADKTLNNNPMTTYNGIGDFAGDYQFRTAGGALSGISIGSVTSSLDGGRRGRLRYDTPSFNGLTFSVAAGTEVLADNDDNFYDAALRYVREFDGTELAVGLGFSRRDSDGVDTDDTFGSIAVRFDNGLNLAFSAGSRKDDGDYTYVLAGYEADFWDFGTTSFAVDYYDGNDFGLDGRSSSSTGFGINQNIDSISNQVYLGYRTHELSDPGVSYQDVDAFLFGTRWRF